jgi:hypothetical protein
VEVPVEAWIQQQLVEVPAEVRMQQQLVEVPAEAWIQQQLVVVTARTLLLLQAVRAEVRPQLLAEVWSMMLQKILNKIIALKSNNVNLEKLLLKILINRVNSYGLKIHRKETGTRNKILEASEHHFFLIYVCRVVDKKSN